MMIRGKLNLHGKKLGVTPKSEGALIVVCFAFKDSSHVLSGVLIAHHLPSTCQYQQRKMLGMVECTGKNFTWFVGHCFAG